jgi:hypothetical protein
MHMIGMARDRPLEPTAAGGLPEEARFQPDRAGNYCVNAKLITELSMKWRTVSVVAALLTTLTGLRVDAQLTQIAGATCESPPPLHCPNVNCPRELIAHDGNALLPKSSRAFFLDYPCDLKPGERVTFVLNLHGGGSIANWQRHYFPIMD